MPRYYFDVLTDAKPDEDMTGTLFDDDALALAYAAKVAAEVALDAYELDGRAASVVVSVRGAHGEPIASITTDVATAIWN